MRENQTKDPEKRKGRVREIARQTLRGKRRYKMKERQLYVPECRLI